LFSSLSGGDSHDLDDDELEHGHGHGHKKNDGGKPVPIRSTFELADTLYAETEEAELEETDTVYLFFFLARSTPFHSHFLSAF
jgi:hypothetical protein